MKLERSFEKCRPDAPAPRSMSAASTTRVLENSTAHDSRFDRRLAEILDYATEIFADKGYEGASMRDLSRLSGMSLAGLYYYFESKEKLLYIIQHHTFTTIIERLRERLTASNDPEERIRIFVQNHVDYALAKDEGNEGAVARGRCPQEQLWSGAGRNQTRVLPHLRWTG